MRGTFLGFLKAIPQVEFCPYLSGDLYIFYPFFKIFSYNKWGLAIPCAISTIMGFYLLYLICKRYFESIWGYLVTFGIVCFNATLINHATEIRTYAFLPTLALAALYLFQKIADSNFQLNITKKIGVAIFFIFLIWFHVYGILMFCSALLFTLLSKYKERDFKIYLKNVIFFTGIILCFAMPLWLYSVFGSYSGYSQLNINPYDYIPNPFHNVLGFLRGILGNMVGFKKLYFLLLGVFIPFVFSYKCRYKQLLFLMLMIIVPISFIFISDMLLKYWFIQRQFIWLMPLFAFFLGWAWDSFFVLLKYNKKLINK
ncbi:MAG: glycosyltransferase family 39 protein [Candidatus Omnitrophica bacterium]|nr:glycosyltransferase family 39 protein [Candidatus Omnitrophota bacterium]